jgi:hypothetical protein
MPVAERLAEAGNSVLMVERGPLSSGRFNGTMKPAWLEGTNLTRFDVPGLFNQIWRDPKGVACDDYDVMAGWYVPGQVLLQHLEPHFTDVIFVAYLEVVQQSTQHSTGSRIPVILTSTSQLAGRAQTCRALSRKFGT